MMEDKIKTTMNFKLFKEILINQFVLKEPFTEEGFHDMYIIYKEDYFTIGETVEYWSNWFFVDRSFESHGQVLKSEIKRIALEVANESVVFGKNKICK